MYTFYLVLNYRFIKLDENGTFQKWLPSDTARNRYNSILSHVTHLRAFRKIRVSKKMVMVQAHYMTATNRSLSKYYIISYVTIYLVHYRTATAVAIIFYFKIRSTRLIFIFSDDYRYTI